MLPLLFFLSLFLSPHREPRASAWCRIGNKAATINGVWPFWATEHHLPTDVLRVYHTWKGGKEEEKEGEHWREAEKREWSWMKDQEDNKQRSGKRNYCVTIKGFYSRKQWKGSDRSRREKDKLGSNNKMSGCWNRGLIWRNRLYVSESLLGDCKSDNPAARCQMRLSP